MLTRLSARGYESGQKTCGIRVEWYSDRLNNPTSFHQMGNLGLKGRSGNALLGSLSRADLALLEPVLLPVTLKFREKLEAAGLRVRDVYFLDRGVASVIAVGSSDRRQAEATIVGREGMSGVSLVLGQRRSPYEVVMQIQGAGQCLPAQDLREAMDQSPTLRAIFARYTYVFGVQVAQTALANAVGTIEERLARWLLMAHDRMNGDSLCITHDLLSETLNVRRAGVTTALHELETRALISMRRASITILDRGGLEASANGLYGVPEAEFNRLFAAA